MKQPLSPSPNSYLLPQLNQVLQSYSHPQLKQEIQILMQFRQHKIYNLFSHNIHAYFGLLWDHIIEINPQFENVVLQQMSIREEKVENDLICQRLKIQQKQVLAPIDYQEETKINKLRVLQQQSESLKQKIKEINSNLESHNTESETKEGKDLKQSFARLYSQQKIKQTEQAIKAYKQAQMQRRKKLQDQRKKQQEQLKQKQTEIKAHQQEMLKARKQQNAKRQKQLQQKREKDKQLRQQRNTEYMRIKKQIGDQPPLHQKLHQKYSMRYLQEQNQRLTKMHSQRKHYLEHVDNSLLQKHQKQYYQLKNQKDQLRRERLSAALNEDARSRAKYHSSYELNKVPDPKEIERQQAKQKAEKMRQYKSIVKQKFRPKIDEDKKRQLINLIEQIEMGRKHAKRVVLQNGSIMYEQLKPADAKMIGMSYLQHTKQMAMKAKQRRKQQKDMVDAQPNKQIKKPINYLEELKKNRPSRQRKTASFMERRNMTFDQKIQKVMQQSQKLAEITKQNQMMLKFGKFKTSQEILACKEQIDQNYLDIVNMKLKLIMSQQKNNDSKQNDDNASQF